MADWAGPVEVRPSDTGAGGRAEERADADREPERLRELDSAPRAGVPGWVGAPRSRAQVYFLIFRLTPEAARENFKPWVVATRWMVTPFWFFMAVVEAPPPTVAPAVAAV